MHENSNPFAAKRLAESMHDDAVRIRRVIIGIQHMKVEAVFGLNPCDVVFGIRGTIQNSKEAPASGELLTWACRG